MKKLYKIGVHSFYRPRAWGDSVEVPNYTFVPPNRRSDVSSAAVKSRGSLPLGDGGREVQRQTNCSPVACEATSHGR